MAEKHSSPPPVRAAAPAQRLVGIWIRVSTEDQAQGESPEHHEKRARMYAEVKGWTVETVYDLSGVSGKTVMEHPEAKRMLEDVRAGRIGALIFSKLARLARNTRELLEFAEYFQQHGADLISLQESIDTSTPSGRFFYTIIAAVAQWEREEIADRVQASVAVRAKLGKPLGAVPFGYQWKDGKFEIHPEEAPVRRLIYELFLQHKRLKRVARILNEAGHRSRRGRQFTPSTLISLIENPTAKGLHRSNYTRNVGGGRVELKPESDWVWTPVDPIVSEQVWEECNAILASRKQGKRPAKKVTHLFAGICHCECGAKMYVPSNMPKYYCRTCLNKIPVEDLESVFVSRLRDFYFDAEAVEEHLQKGQNLLADRRSVLGTLETERERVATESEKLYRLYLADQLTVDSFGARNRPLEERLKQLSEEIPRLQGEVDFLAIEHLSASSVAEGAQDLYSRWDTLTFEERRAIVEAILERITISKEEVVIDLHYVPAPRETVAIGPCNLTGVVPQR